MKGLTFLVLTATATVTYILYLYWSWKNFIDILISFALRNHVWLPIMILVADHYYLKGGWHPGTILKLSYQCSKTSAVELFYLKLCISPFCETILVYCMSTRGQCCPFVEKSYSWQDQIFHVRCWGAGRKKESLSRVWKWKAKKIKTFEIKENGIASYFKGQRYKKFY